MDVDRGGKRAADTPPEASSSPRLKRLQPGDAESDARATHKAADEQPGSLSMESPTLDGSGSSFGKRGDLSLGSARGTATASPLAAEAAASLASIARAALPPSAISVGSLPVRGGNSKVVAITGGGQAAPAAASKGGAKKGGKRKAGDEGSAGPAAATAGAGGGKASGSKSSAAKSGGAAAGAAAASGGASGGGSSSGSTKPSVPSIHVGGMGEGSIAANVGAGGKRRLTRGVVPALKNELEELMASAPVAPPEGWVKKPDGDAAEEGAPTTWEGWERRLKDERVPAYVIEDLWRHIEFTAKAIQKEARTGQPDIPSTLEVGRSEEEAAQAADEPASGEGGSRGVSPPSGADPEGGGVPKTWEELLASVATDIHIPYGEGDEESLHAISAELLLGGYGDGDGEGGDVSHDGAGATADADADAEDDMTTEELARHLAGELGEAEAAPSAAAAAEGGVGGASEAAANGGSVPVAVGEPSAKSNEGGGGGGGGGANGGGGSNGGNGGAAASGNGGSGGASGGGGGASGSGGPSQQSRRELEPGYWARDLVGRLKRLLTVGSTPISFGQLYYLLMGTLAGHTKMVNAHTALPPPPAGDAAPPPPTKAELIRSNLAHHAARRARRLANELMDAFLAQCRRTARAMRLDVALAGKAVELRKALRELLAVGHYGEYETMTKEEYNRLIGQEALWVHGERARLLKELCTRDGETMITPEFFEQHTSKNASELYVLVHFPTCRIVGLAAVADFQTPWTAGQFHHMAHACQEDRMFFLGRKSEKDLTPKVALDMSSSFEGGTRWTSHFHMPTLLAVDVICVRPGMRGLAHILLAHLLCLSSYFTADRTHVLFDISGREKNVRMCKFAAAIGAIRCQTYADEARSEGYVGVEGDDPSIYWTYKDGSRGYGVNDGKTSGVYAIDVELEECITTQHPAVIFNDRVTLADFHRGNKNCSYFAVAPLETAQQKLAAILGDLRAQSLEAEAARGAELRQPPWRENSQGDLVKYGRDAPTAAAAAAPEAAAAAAAPEAAAAPAAREAPAATTHVSTAGAAAP